jgi:hypothetical protein
MRRTLLAFTLAAAGALAVAGRAEAQVIYYGTPVYYHSPHNPLVRTYSTAAAYSTYTSPIIVPTRFTYPYWGQVTWGNAAQFQPPPPAKKEEAKDGKKNGDTTAAKKDGDASSGAVTQAAFVPPAPAWVQVGPSTYTAAPVAVGAVYYSGDAYIPPSWYYYYPYSTYPTAGFAPYGATAPPATGTGPAFQDRSYGGYTTPYFQVSFGSGYGNWGDGRGWGYRW